VESWKRAIQRPIRLFQRVIYANPIYDQPKEDPEAIKNGSYAVPNLWPKQDLPDMEYAFKNLGKIIVDTSGLLARHLDKYVSKRVPNIDPHKFHKMITQTTQYTGRLLHYFPTFKAEESKEMKSSEGNWCGWHNDHSALTGLTSAMYIDQNGKVVEFFDEDSGLFIRGRNAVMVKAAIPKDCLAFQIGETSQILSGGHLIATPHCVVQGKKLQGTGISRNTYANFTAPEWNEQMKVPPGCKRENAFVKDVFGIPKLQDRWEEEQNYFDFSVKTFKYYN